MFTLGRSILLAFLTLVGNVGANSAEAAALQIQIYDYANLEPQTLSEFLIWTERILVNTGMSVEVSLCRGSIAVSCENPTGTLDTLLVRVVGGDTKTPKHANRLPLGQSFASQHGGTHATIYLLPVQDQAAATSLPWVILLAHAAAHEVGHLLLGTQAHTSRGLMKANWDRDDYLAMDHNQCHFTPEQSRMLAKRYPPAADHRSPECAPMP